MICKTNYFREATLIPASLMKKPDSVCKNINVHKTLYVTFAFQASAVKRIPFQWMLPLDSLDLKKQEISHGTYSQYRNALFRLEHYLLFLAALTAFCVQRDFFSAGAACPYPLPPDILNWKNIYDAVQNPHTTILMPLPLRNFSGLRHHPE